LLCSTHARAAAQLQKLYDKAKSLPRLTGVDCTKLTRGERRELSFAGLSFTEERDHRVVAFYPQTKREEDLRQAVLAKRARS